MGFRVMGVKAGFRTLDAAAVNKSYRAAAHRLILLDWGGTLVAESDAADKLHAFALATGIASRAGPTESLKQTLETLCADPKNVVFVVSGKETHAVDAFFGDVKGLGLGAEHGFYYRWPVHGAAPLGGVPVGGKAPPRGSGRARWSAMHTLNEADQQWKDPGRKLMHLYMERTHGTYIEHKGNALIWQFRDADPEFGYMQSKELEEHLTELMAGHPVEVIRGGGVSDGYIEIRPKGVSKGLFLKHALGVLEAQGGKVDFCLAVGDDSSDEPMFEQIALLSAAHTPSEALSAYSVSVGKRSTAAQSYVDDPAAVLELLASLCKSSALARGFSSSLDMTAERLTRASSERLAAGVIVVMHIHVLPGLTVRCVAAPVVDDDQVAVGGRVRPHRGGQPLGPRVGGGGSRAGGRGGGEG